MAATFKQGAQVGRWEKNLDNPQAALKQIGAVMVAESQQAFKAQKFGKESWEPRAVPNVYGIVADFHAGKKKPPARRFEDRPVLRDTGRLAASISFSVVSSRTVEVGSNLSYAATLHRGGKIESKPITKSVQETLAKWLKGAGKAWKGKLGFLLNPKFTGETLKGRVVARPFMGITKATIADVKEIVGVSIMEVN